MKLFNTIQGRLFVCYTTIIVVLVLALFSVFNYYASQALTERASESLLQLAINNNSNLDAMIENMDSTANRIVSSSLIKASFYKDAADPSQELQYRREMMDLLFTVNGSKIDYRINLLSDKGKFVEFGRNFDVSALAKPTLNKALWLNDCLALEGKMYVASPHPYEWGRSDELVFSVCRAFNRTFGAPYDAVAEVVVDYDDFAQAVRTAVRPDRVNVHVYDSVGRLIYPLNAAASTNHYAAIPAGQSSGTLSQGSGREREISAFSRSAYSGLTMVISENESVFLEPVRLFRNRLVLAGIIAAIITTLMSSILSKQLTEPMRQIQESISKLELSDLHSESVPDKTSTYELTKLSSTYTKMVERLQESLEETVDARSRETEARMLALQAQMNPHFLYNIITVISIKAEDNEDPEVVGMCECLSEMLRYVTRDTAREVPMGRELEYLEQYLYLMRCRYPGHFTAELDVPEGMQGLIVPKLVVQPLVENSFQHGFRTSGAWQLRLKGELSESGWRLTVTDNGAGFSDEVLEQLRRQFNTARGDFQETPSDHIGLTNIFERLRFRYRAAAVFEVKNLPEGGCSVTIGGERENKSHEEGMA